MYVCMYDNVDVCFMATTVLLPTVAKLMDVELAGEGVLSLIIHPGHVQCATTPPLPLHPLG